MKCRVITNGSYFKVQYRVWWFIWNTFESHQDWGGDLCFKTKEEAQAFAASKKEARWTVVK